MLRTLTVDRTRDRRVTTANISQGRPPFEQRDPPYLARTVSVERTRTRPTLSIERYRSSEYLAAFAGAVLEPAAHVGVEVGAAYASARGDPVAGARAQPLVAPNVARD